MIAALSRGSRCLKNQESMADKITKLQEADLGLGGALDSAWLCLCGALVMFMHAGFAMLETGCCRAKNASNVLMKNLVNVCCGTLGWWSIGWALAYGEQNGNGFIGTDGFFGFGFYTRDKASGVITPVECTADGCQSTMLSCTMVFYLLVVRALSGPWFQWSRTKRRRKCLNIFSLLCGAACCLFGCTAFVSTILGLGFMFMLNRFENKTRKRSWKIRMHRRMKPWKLRWYASRGSFPLRNLRPYSAVDGDCLFVSFSQGLASVGIQVGPRKPRKVAWQMLRRDNCAAAAWDGFLPCSGLSSRDWSEYLGEIRTPGSWASLLEAKVLAEAFQVNVCITNGYVTKSFCQEPTSNKHFHLKFYKQHYIFVPQQRTSDRDFLTSKLRQWCKLFSFVPFSRKQVFESWRGGSAKATARKRDTREAMRALKNIKLPGQFAFLSPLIPMLVDLLALHPSKLTVKPKKKKKTKAKPIPHAKPDAVQKDATAEVRPPCWYHQKGCCKFGDSCWYSHSHVPPQQSQPAKSREEVESKTSPSKSSAFLPWDLRKDDWNGEIHSLASFSNRLDQLSTTSKLHAVVKVDSDKELDTIKELLAQSDYDLR